MIRMLLMMMMIPNVARGTLQGSSLLAQVVLCWTDQADATMLHEQDFAPRRASCCFFIGLSPNPIEFFVLAVTAR